MNTPSKDNVGDSLKAIERIEAGRAASPLKPLMCRLDGKSFHTFTRGLKRPYDTRLSDLMIDTARYLVEKTHARLGYTQSDEITLHWSLDGLADGAEYMFGGKYQKLTSVLAAHATAFFNTELALRIPEKAAALPIFDARVWNIDSHSAVYDNYLWRQDDAIKNSISMAAQAKFSHKTLHGVGSEAKKQMLREVGSPWEDEPLFFKSGTFVKREAKLVKLTDEQLAKIPEKHRPKSDELIPRTVISALDIGYLPNISQEEHEMLFLSDVKFT